MKRFTETLKWSKPWFRQLPPKHKLLWQWMCDTCDNAGILDADWGLASFQIGCDFTAFDVEVFEGRVTILQCGKVWIPSFITFQCSTLSRECKAHGPIFVSLEKHGIDPDTLTPIGYPIGYKENSNRVYYTHKEKEKEKETETETETETEESQKPKRPKKTTPLTWNNQTGWVGLTPEIVVALNAINPGVDLEQEMAHANVWLLDQGRPHSPRAMSFLSNWLKKAKPVPEVATIQFQRAETADMGWEDFMRLTWDGDQEELEDLIQNRKELNEEAKQS